MDWVEVPHQRLPDSTLNALLEEACTRDGTEMSDASDKILQLRNKLEKGLIQLRFYPEDSSCQLVWTKLA